MANVTITGLTPAAALTGTEVLAIDQTGSTVKTTVQDVADLALGELEIVADGSLGGPVSFSYSIKGTIPLNTTGTTYVTPKLFPYISLDASTLTSQFTATNVSFPSITNIDNLQIRGTSTLQVLSAPLLEYMNGSLNFQNNSQLTTLNFPLLRDSYSLNFGGTPNLTTINFPLLENSNLVVQYINSAITGFRQSMFPALRTGSFDVGYQPQPSFEIDFPLLTTLGYINGNANSANLTNINLPSVINVKEYYLSVSGGPTLTNLIIGAVGVTKKWGAESGNALYFNNDALNQASVDNFLLVLASLDGTNGTTIANNGTLNLSGGTNAAPSLEGDAAKQILINRGWSVAHNV